MSKKHLYISVAGVLGSGKSTAAKLIAQHCKLPLFEENFAKNIFLPLFYKNPKRWAFHSQLFFLNEKASQLSDIQRALGKTSVVQDCPMEQDYLGYAKAQHLLGYIAKEEFDLYERLYRSLNNRVPQPDLIIQLDARPRALHERIAKRSRGFETGVRIPYLKTLVGLQNKWLAKHPARRILRINSEALNLAASEEDRKKFVKLVQDRIHETKHP